MRTAILLTLLFIAGCAPVDIRPDEFKKNRITPESVRKGRSLLDAAAETHGLKKWTRLTSSEIVLRDHWQGWMGKIFMPWPTNNRPIRFYFLNNTYYGRAEFLEGKNRGEIWGIQAWETYRQQPGEKVRFKEHNDTRFYLPTYQYFFEFPFQVRKAPLVAYIGDRELNGQSYHLIFATWETAEPHPDFDQYIVWIHTKTKRIEYTEYTVRDLMRFAKGAMHFTQFQTVNNVLIPFTMTALSSVEDQDYLHRLQIESVTFDTAPKKAFFPDPSKPFTADGKPER